MESNIVQVSTRKSLEAACRAFEAAVASHGFGVLHVHDLQAALQKKGFDLSRGVRVYDVCNPARAKQALDHDPAIAAALPCAVSVIADGDGARFVYVRPTVMLGLFGIPGVDALAAEVERTVRRIVDDAAHD